MRISISGQLTKSNGEVITLFVEGDAIPYGDGPAEEYVKAREVIIKEKEKDYATEVRINIAEGTGCS